MSETAYMKLWIGDYLADTAMLSMEQSGDYLHLLMASFYRPTRDRHVILIEQGAFPSDRYAVASQVAWHGFDPAATLVQVGPRPGEHLLRHEDFVAEIARHAVVQQRRFFHRIDLRRLAGQFANHVDPNLRIWT